MKFTNLQAANEALAAKAEHLHKVFEAAGAEMDMTKVLGMLGVPDTAGAAAKIRELNAELTDIGRDRDALAELDKASKNASDLYDATHKPATGVTHPTEGAQAGREAGKTIGQLFVESAEFRQFKGQRSWPSPVNLPNLDVRATVFQTGGGWDPQIIRIPRVELNPQRPIAVVDNVPMFPTDQSAINYMEETTFTNNAAETAESTATTASNLIGESALALTERTQPVEWLPVFIPVTQQQMEDVAGIGA